MKNLFGSMVDIAIDRLKAFEPSEGYWVGFSGGKDSMVVRKLCQIGGIKCSYHYSMTTIDPPDLIYYMRKYHTDIIWERPVKPPFFIEMVKRGYPTRQGRWCCADYKERGGEGRIIVTGVRWAESSKRAGRKMVSFYKGKKILSPIIDWEDNDVWDFIKNYKMPYCKLYDEGWDRIGCIGCPLAKQSNREREFERYPAFDRAYRRAFIRLYDRKKKLGHESIQKFKDGNHMYDLWRSGETVKKQDGCDGLFT